MYLFITLLILLLLCINHHVTKFRLYKLSWNIPGPLALPFIGSAYLFIGNAKENSEKFMALFSTYPDLAKIWMGSRLCYLVTKPEYLEIVLNSTKAFNKVGIYKFVKPIVGNGLLTGPANIWRRHRKVIAPSLNQKVLNQYPKYISEQCNILIKILQDVSGEEISFQRYFTNCTAEIICETLFGVPLNTQFLKHSYTPLFDEALEPIFEQIFGFLYKFEFIFKQTNKYKRVSAVRNQIKKIVCDLIDRKLEQKKLETETTEIKSFLDLVVEKYLSNEWSRSELEDEVCTLFLGGTATNAATVSFALAVLGIHEEIQEKVYNEANEVLGSNNLVQAENLSKLKYTERVIKETLRIFPAAAFSGRIADEDINLGSAIIPKSSNVLFNFFHLHRNEQYWPDPLKFDPNRFLPERSSGRHPFTWLPFSAGPRDCIGIRFGMMASKILVAMIIRQFKVKSSLKNIQDLEIIKGLIIKPRDELKLTFKCR